MLARLSGLAGEALHERLRSDIDDLSLADRFELIHRLGIYHHAETFSGDASTLAETAALRAALPELIQRHGIRSLLDVPCGDFHWLSRVDLEVDYLGGDIVPALVDANREKYAGARRRFVVIDATLDPLPRADLVLCRDLLIHLSLEDCAAVLRNIAASGSRWLLTNHFLARQGNSEIVSGDFRPVNLCLPPFGLVEPTECFDEKSRLAEGAFADRAMALWPIEAVRTALGEPNRAG